MAYVGFKRGLHANLPTQQNDMQEGYFYLTSDTDRLYICKATNNVKELVELNKSITTVADLQSLPSSGVAEGQFYYIEPGQNGAGNILCVYHNNAWVQINPDTKLSQSTTNLTVATEGSGVKVTSRVTDTTGTVSTGNFTVTGGGVITVSKDTGNGIVINAPQGIDTQYDLTAGTSASNNPTISLSNRDTTPEVDTIEIVATQNITAATTAATQSDPAKITITGPQERAVTTASFSDAGVLSINTKVDGNVSTAGTVTPHIKYGKTAGATPVQYGTTATFNSGDANLDVYTTGQVDALIDSKLQEADAMTYRGVVNVQSDLPSGNTAIHKGDTYKIGNSGITINGVTANIGDLVIYGGEDANTVDAQAWDIVPSGNDQLISVTATAGSATHKIDIKDNGVAIGGIELVAGQNIAISSTATNNKLVATISEDAAYTSQTVSGSTSDVTMTTPAAGSVIDTKTFTAVTAIETDAYGNVVDSSINTATLTVKDTHANISAVTVAASNESSANTVKVTTTVRDTDTISKNGNFTITSGNFTVAADSNNQIAISLEWGSF